MSEKKSLSPFLILIGLSVLLIFLESKKEEFYNIVPTMTIDPEFREPVAAYGVPFQRVGDNHSVDLACHNVDLYDIACWIAHEDPRLMYEAVIRWDPSINPLNPNHTPRVLRMLLQNLPSYTNGIVRDKYLPIIRKCFPKEVRV